MSQPFIYSNRNGSVISELPLLPRGSGGLDDPDGDVGVAAADGGEGAVDVDVRRLHREADGVEFVPGNAFVLRNYS